MMKVMEFPVEVQSGPDSIREMDGEFLLPVYPRYGVVLDRGEGPYLIDAEGRRYLDLMTGLGVNVLGHAHPRLVEVYREQAALLVHISNHYANRYSAELAEKLCALSGMGGVFFSTAGTEAVEGAIKLARTVGRSGYGARKHVIVALEGGYHGRTMGALSVTGQQKYREDFEPGMPGVRFAMRDDLESLRKLVDDDTCAILIEPLMGEGGVRECSSEFLAEARRLADAHNALLIFDEIQTGLGRTGRWFAFERCGVRPDVVVVGKALGGGLPLSAILVRRDLRDAFGPGKHGSTLGGGPLACRLGLELISVIEGEGLLERVERNGAALAAGLQSMADDLEIARGARGRGMLQGLALSIPARPVVEAGLGAGLMLNAVQGMVLRFLPPYILTDSQIEFAVETLRALLVQAQVDSRVPLAD
jgi:predicted acetylornithine/succinylornithine family transaminase